MLKIAVFSMAVVIMVTAEPPNGGYSPGPGPSGGGYHLGGGGGGGGYNGGDPYHRQPSQQQPYRIKSAGPSKIFGWLGSKLPKIPSFLPRFPHFPKYKPNNLPNYQAVILPQPPKIHYGTKHQQGPEKVQIFGPSYASHSTGQNYYSAPASPAVVTYQPVQQQQQQQFRPAEQNVEVLPSQLISYEKEIVSGNHNQNYYQPSPVSSPPLYQSGGGGEQIPKVPLSNGPDYFNTAYTQDGQQYQTNYSPQQYSIQTVESDNYGATFNNVQMQAAQSQAAPQIYDASIDLKAIGGPVIESQSQQQQEQSYLDGSAVAGQDASLSSIISSLTESTGQQQTAYSQQHSVTAVYPSQQQQKQQQQYQYIQEQEQQPSQYSSSQDQQTQQSQNVVRVTSPYSRVGNMREIVPGVKLMSQGTAEGNPVFEVVADANTPTFNGHPFDINKLIEMIEPGAQLESVPQLSEASSENKETYVEAPAQAVSIDQSSSSGTEDLHFSESEPQPIITNKDGTRISAMPSSLIPNDDNDDYIIDETMNEKNNVSDSSLMDIMEFFKQNGGKGYVVVEKKGSNLTLTNDTDLTIDHDDEGPSLLNITSETIPQLELQQNTKLIDPTYPKKFSSVNTKSNSSFTPFVKLPNSTYLNPTAPSRTTNIVLPPIKSQTIPVVFPTRKSKPYINIRPSPSVPTKTTAKLAFKPNYTLPPQTTENPNHNYKYKVTTSTTSSDYPLLGIIPGLPNDAPKFNPLLDSVVDTPIDDDDESTVDDLLETDGDLAISESKQVKSIAITVTPPTLLLKNSVSTTTPGSISSENPSNTDSTTISNPTATQKSVSTKSSKSFPFPVYRKKTETTN